MGKRIIALTSILMASCAAPLLQTPPQMGQVQPLFTDQQKAISGFSHFDRLEVGQIQALVSSQFSPLERASYFNRLIFNRLVVWNQHLCGVYTIQRQFSMTCLALATQRIIYTEFNDAPFPFRIPRVRYADQAIHTHLPSFTKDEQGKITPISPSSSSLDGTEDYPMVLGAGRAGVYLGLADHLIQSSTISDWVPDLKWTALLLAFPFAPQPEVKTAEQIEVLSALAETANGDLFLADWKRNQIVKLKEGKFTVFAGSGKAGFKDGNPKEAQFNQIQALEADSQGNLYLLEKDSHRVRKIASDGTVSTLAGGAEAGYREGPGNEAHLNQPSALAVSPEGSVFVADTGNNRIRKIEPNGQVSTFIGNGQAGVEKGDANSTNSLNGPRLEVAITPTSLALGPDGILYFTSGKRVFRTPTH